MLKPGQIAILDTPTLRNRAVWRYIVLDGPSKDNKYRLYCIRSPGYRKRDVGKIFTMNAFNMRSLIYDT